MLGEVSGSNLFDSMKNKQTDKEALLQNSKRRWILHDYWWQWKIDFLDWSQYFWITTIFQSSQYMQLFWFSSQPILPTMPWCFLWLTYTMCRSWLNILLLGTTRIDWFEWSVTRNSCSFSAWFGTPAEKDTKQRSVQISAVVRSEY